MSEQNQGPFGKMDEEAIRIYKQRVFAAADELATQGIKPSVRKVIARMPGGGSPNIVGPILREWKLMHEQGEQERQQQRQVPPALAEAFLKCVDELDRDQKQSLREEKAAAEEDSETLQEQLNQVIRERDDAQEENTRISEELQQAKAQAQANKEAYDALLVNYNALQDKLRSVEAEAADAKAEAREKIAEAAGMQKVAEKWFMQFRGELIDEIKNIVQKKGINDENEEQATNNTKKGKRNKNKNNNRNDNQQTPTEPESHFLNEEFQAAVKAAESSTESEQQ